VEIIRQKLAVFVCAICVWVAGIAAGGCAFPVESAAGQDLADEALESVAAARRDLGIPPDLNTRPRPARFDGWIGAPFRAPIEAQADARRLFAASSDPVLWLETLGGLSDLGEIPPLAQVPFFAPIANHRVPDDLLACIEPLLAAMQGASHHLRTCLGVRDEPWRRQLIDYLFRSGIMADPAADEEMDPVPVEEEIKAFVDQASQVDRNGIFAAGRAVVKAMRQVKACMQSLLADGRMIETQVFNTDLGRVEIGGPGPDLHEANAALIIDVGGDDTYRGRTAYGRDGACSVVLDLAGDDFYLGEDFTQGSGICGIGILWDVEGNDVYRAGSLAQGSGVFGIGLVVDEGGRDHYSGGAFVQAASAWGWGGLLDLGGEDRYECRHSGQAFSGVMGVSCLCDLSGNDKYLSGAAQPDHRDPDMNQSFAQGFAAGMRDLTGGGYAILADQWGNDLYECQYFGQGSGYYMGMGVLYDQDGEDTYAARRYAQGAGIHYALGLLLDAGGHDRYVSWGVSQGCGHDYGVGILIDQQGDDLYTADWLAMGASNANGTGIFIDNGGDDRYGPKSSMPVGKMSKGRRSGGIGLFVDAGGKDAYAREGGDNTLWGEGRHAVGIDRDEGGSSGVALLVSQETAPENPEAVRKREAESKRLSGLIAQAESLNSPESVGPLLKAASHRGLEKEIPKRAKRLLLAMDPKQSIPSVVDRLDVLDLSSLSVVKSLFLRHGLEAVSTLIAAPLRDSPVFEARRCYFLGMLKDTRSLSTCMQALENHSRKVQSTAIRAVGDMLDRGRLDDLLPMNTVLERTSQEANPEVLAIYLSEDPKRGAKVWSVASRTVPVPFEVYEAFGGPCKDGKDDGVNETVEAFICSHVSQILPVLQTWIADIRGSQEIAAQLVPCLRDPDPEVRRATAYAVGQMRYRPAISSLLDLLHDPHLWVRDSAVLSLALFQADAVGPLAARMKQEGPGFRILALDALSRIDAPGAREQVVWYLTDDDANVKRAAKQHVDGQRESGG
jgi:hypothetical protein